jgi:hypothetical protein
MKKAVVNVVMIIHLACDFDMFDKLRNLICREQKIDEQNSDFKYSFDL